jgi:hypothetical protein
LAFEEGSKLIKRGREGEEIRKERENEIKKE